MFYECWEQLGTMVDVADTSALLAWPPARVSTSFAVPSQMAEVVKFSPERGMLYESQGPQWTQPSPESIEAAKNMGAATGDLPQLSSVDIELLALCIEMSAILHTDDYRMQNVAGSAGIVWKPVTQKGISSGWTWELQCTGCGKKKGVPSGEVTIEDCENCGSPRKLKRKRQ